MILAFAQSWWEAERVEVAPARRLKRGREETDEMKQEPWLWSDSFSPRIYRCTWSSLYGWMNGGGRSGESQVCSLRWSRWWLDCLVNDWASPNGPASSISVSIVFSVSFSLAPVFSARYSKSRHEQRRPRINSLEDTQACRQCCWLTCLALQEIFVLYYW